MPKLERTRSRDIRAINELTTMGWDTLVIWECETASVTALEARIQSFLG